MSCALVELGFLGDKASRRDRAGIPNASVLPLPVSAIPITSWPNNAAGHVHAWIGVGSLNPVKAVRRLEGISSWEKERMGVTEMERLGGV